MKRTYNGLFLFLIFGTSFVAQAEKLSETGLFENIANLMPAQGFIEYQVNVPLWSDGTKKRRWIRVPNGTSVNASDPMNWTYPNGTVFMKFFELEVKPGVTKRLELRVFKKVSNQEERGGWVSKGYRFNAEGTDADYVEGSQYEDIEVINEEGKPEKIQWMYPSSSMCKNCHGYNNTRPLGFNTYELNSNPFESSELKKIISEIKVERLGAIETLPMFSNQNNGNHARAYLAVNCAHCHNPDGSAAFVMIDFRYETPLEKANLVKLAPMYSSMGVPGAYKIYPGKPEKSVVYLRMKNTDFYRMPRMGSVKEDVKATQLVAEWITQLNGN